MRDASGQPDIRLHGKPSAPGVQTALVVGLGQDPIHSDREGRIQIQYHWQRGSQSSPRQSSPAHHDGDNAPANASIGTWVRVLQTQAGSNWGSHYTPRLGQEVLVGYLHNDIDRPVIIGSLYNGQGQPEHASNQLAQGAAGSTGNAPAWFPGSSASNTDTSASTNTSTTEQAQWQNHRHDAILSGYKSQELGSSHSGNGGYNQLLIDSSAGQGRLELASSPDAAGRQATRLQLGHLLQQTDNRRQQSRGHGLDLYTPHWGAVRAGSGLLISSQAEPASHQSGQQLQSEQAQQELAQSQQLLQTLAADAQKHQAQAAENEAAIRYLQTAQQGPTEQGATNQDPIDPNIEERLPADADLQALRHSLAQTRSSQPSEAANIGGGHGTIGAWASPEILLASPEGIHSASSGQSHFASGGSYSAIARQHINQMASAQYSLSSAQSIVLYTVGKAAKGQQPVQEEGIRLHAATGSVVVQAQNNRLEATAKQQVAVDSTHGSVKSGARGHQLLVAAGSAIEMKDGNITLLTRGNVLFKASQKVLTGPQDADSVLNLPPLYDEQFCIRDNQTGEPLPFVKYRIEDAGGAVLARGITDEWGKTLRVFTGDARGVRVVEDE